MLSIIGNWGNPIGPDKHRSIVQSVVERFKYRCVYCSFRSVATPNNPFGRLHVCSAEKGMTLEAKNCIPLCDMCVNLNSLEALENEGKPVGFFIELPWLKQSDLTSLVRTAYAYNFLADQQENREILHNTAYHQAVAKLLHELRSRQPKDWLKHGFDGKVSTLIEILKDYKGYQEDLGGTIYLDRLRFLFSEESFADSIGYWSTLLKPSIIEKVSEGDKLSA